MIELPRYLQLLWDREPEGRRGPKPGRSITEIGAAAGAIADADGLDAVSMKSVAAAVGFTTMSLYRYVDSKDELYAVMIDVAYGPPDLRYERGEGWRERMARWATTDHRAAPGAPLGDRGAPGLTTADPQRDRLDGVRSRGARGRGTEQPTAPLGHARNRRLGARTTCGRASRWGWATGRPTPTARRAPTCRSSGCSSTRRASPAWPPPGPRRSTTMTRTSSPRSSTAVWASFSTASRRSSHGRDHTS